MGKRDYESEILDYLRARKLGVNIAKIAKTLRINKITVSKYLKKLELGDLILSKEITRTRKLWYHKK